MFNNYRKNPFYLFLKTKNITQNSNCHCDNSTHIYHCSLSIFSTNPQFPLFPLQHPLGPFFCSNNSMSSFISHVELNLQSASKRKFIFVVLRQSYLIRESRQCAVGIVIKRDFLIPLILLTIFQVFFLLYFLFLHLEVC